jgi:hypothetical protein
MFIRADSFAPSRLGSHDQCVAAVRTLLVLLAELRQILAERLAALLAQEREFARGLERVVAQLEMAFGAVKPAAAARRTERALHSYKSETIPQEETIGQVRLWRT